MFRLGNDWQELLAPEYEKDYYKRLREFLIEEYRNHVVHPDMGEIFSALTTTAYKDVKVVILGQDPYHGYGQAHGMCFSVKKGVQPPPSLVNIFKELSADLGFGIPKDGFLKPWAKQGVLLLNTVLTVRHGEALSHRGKGWEQFTDRIITLLNEREDPIIFVLWGAQARSKKALITNDRHYIIEAAHPSPLSAYNGFFGSRPFSKINGILREEGKEPIDWNL